MRLAGATQQKEIVTTLLASENAHLETLTAKLATNTELCEKLRADLERLKTQEAGYNDEIEKLNAEYLSIEASIEEIKAYRQIKDEERNDALDEMREVEKKIGAAAIRLAEVHKDIEALEARRAQLGARMTEIAESVMHAEQAQANYRTDILRWKKQWRITVNRPRA